ALLVAFLVCSKSSGGAGGPRGDPARQPGSLALIVFLPAFVLLAVPLHHAAWEKLGVGATSLRQTINEITAVSLGTSLKLIGAIARVGLALAAVAGIYASARYWRRRDGGLIP